MGFTKPLALFALLALAACQTLPSVVMTGRDTFDIRYDDVKNTNAEIDARARELCHGPATLIGNGTRWDGFAYRSYSCGGR